MDEMWPKCSQGDKPLTAGFSTLLRSRWYLSRLFAKKVESFRFAVVRPPLAALTGSTSWSISMAESAFDQLSHLEQRHNHSNGGNLTTLFNYRRK